METNTNNSEEKWETIYLNTNRWKEVERELNVKLDGYGKLYKKEYEVWYVDKGSKEKKSIQQIIEISPEYYYPQNYKQITGTWVDFNDLTNTKGYLQLYSGLDETKSKRWYFALRQMSPLFITTKKNDYSSNKKSNSRMKTTENKPDGSRKAAIITVAIIIATICVCAYKCTSFFVN